MPKIDRNAPCPCGSGKKYKHCCLRKDQAAQAEARAAQVIPVESAEALPNTPIVDDMDLELTDYDRGTLEALGISPDELADISFEELSARAAETLSNPERLVQFEAYLDEHPNFVDQLEEDWDARLDDFSELLGRPEGEPLLLTMEEVGPWLGKMAPRVSPIIRKLSQNPSMSHKQEERLKSQFREAVSAVAGEMAPAVYTPERIERLMADMAACQDQFDAAGDEQAADTLASVLVDLEAVPDPESGVLFAIAYASLIVRWDQVLDTLRGTQAQACEPED